MLDSPPTSPATLLARLAAGTRRAAFTFAGRAGDPLAELRALLALRPELREGALLAADAIGEVAGSPRGRASGRFRHGADVPGWIELPDAAPPDAYLRSAPIAHPLILLAQALLWRALAADGLAGVRPVAVAGHSQGLWAALMVAEAAGRDDDGLDDELLAAYLRRACMHGVAAAQAARAAGPGGETPMAAVSGPRVALVEAEAKQLNARLPAAEHVTVGLVNTRTRVVASGPPASLALLRAALERRAADEREARRRGRSGGSPLAFAWTPLAVDVPYHDAVHAPALERLLDWLAEDAPLPAASSLAIPLLCPSTGADLREADDLARAVAGAPLVARGRWDLVADSLVARGADWVLDLGPGTEVAQLTAENLRGSGARSLPLAAPDGRRVLTTPGAAPEGPDVRWPDFAPAIVALPDGRRHVDTRFTRHAGRPPVLLAGMTPTTAEAPVVAAAANAGFHAELAGGGQPDRETFETRIAELRELLEPGAEVVFNTLLLDRRPWELHVSREALLFAARRDGAPLNGLTVSAGIPDVAEAIELLDRLAALGMTVNAFKPGTVEQVRQLLAIADAAPHHVVCAHVEGGASGGHHSWEELEDVLLATYHELRRRPNVIVCAAGGVADPARAAELLSGRWALAHGERPMPLDGVLLGTVAMACAEAGASPQVKAALAAAAGGEWVPRGAAVGGVASARSNLGADIHVLDNAAARAAHLVDELAGDAAAVAARRGELIEALAATAKPYFGDLDAMTYGELLARFTERCAIGRDGRYDDGRWGHATWRARALALYRRAGARLAAADEGPVTVPVSSSAQLDDPRGALAVFLAAHPEAATTLLHPADARRFVAVCDGPGKPVPFVAALDGDVRRRFMADALWQAQDDRLDADAVFAIPGPRSVRGIERAGEPVAELLARFEAGVLEELDADGAAVAQRDRLADPGPAPRPLADAVAGARGALAALCAAPSVLDADGGVRPNPLWRLVRPGDALAAERDEDGVLRELRARAGDDRVHARLDAATGEVEVRVELAGDAPARLALRFRGAGDGGGAPFAELDGRGARASFVRAELLDGAAPVADPCEPVQAGWTCEPGVADAYRAATGAAHEGVPLELALTLGRPVLCRLLAADLLAPRLAALVHAGHAVEPGPAWPPLAGETGEAEGRVVELDDPAGAPTRLTVQIALRCARGSLAVLTTDLAVLDDAPLGPWSLRTRREHDVELELDDAAAELLAAQPWLRRADVGGPLAGRRLRVRAATATDRPRAGATRWRADGAVEAAAGREPLAAIALDRTGAEREHPVQALLALLAPAARETAPRPRLPLAAEHDAAPLRMEAFARIGGDANPLHRSPLAARLAGLERPIVHGAWTAARASAFAVDAVAGGEADALRAWRMRFLAPVAPGALLELQATRVGVRDGARAVEVDVRCDGATVALGEALLAPPRTALAFPGQGVQRRGLGAEQRARSRAAREVWERADATVRACRGISLLEVVERNPSALRRADRSVLRHPAGVLFRTELTQAALVAHAAAQVAELRAEGVLGRDGFVAAGHSVGEISALVALGALELEAAVELVLCRGEAMQAHVPRDAAGASPYRLAVVDPGAAGIADEELEALLAEVAARSGEPLSVAGRNARGAQYAVAGTERAIAELGRALGRGRGERAAGAVRPVSGIDVPFHSPLLAPAVAPFSRDVERLLPARVEADLLVGRWIPNLVGEPFAAADGDDPARVRSRVVDLLARQIAAPVRWIETQLALAAPVADGGLGVRRVIEVGPGHAPVLTGLARTTYAAVPLAGPAPALLHAEGDRVRVLERDEAPPPAEDAPAAPAAAAANGGQPPVVASASARAAPLPDRPLDVADALRIALALQARVRLDQLRDDETIEECFQGVSSRRNQVLIDLGRELGVAGPSDVHQQPIGDLARALRERGAAYRFPGPYLREALAAGVTRALGGSGVAPAEARARLARRGLPAGLVERALVALALDTRPGPSARGGELGPLGSASPSSAAQADALLAAAAARVAAELGLALPGPDATDGAPDAAAVADGPLASAAVHGIAQALREAAATIDARFGGGADAGDDDAAAPARPQADRLALLDAELGAARAEEVASRFDARRHVRFASAWASARWDLVAAWHAARDGRLAGAALEAELARIALHGDEPAVAATARWLADRAAQRGDAALADALRAISPARRTPLPLAGVRPVTELGADGLPRVGVAPDPARPRDLLEGLAPPGLATALDAALRAAPDLRGEVALVTGASPGSIAAELVRRLLRGGATVVVATSDDSPERRRWYRDLHRTAAGPGAQLHVLRANLASFADVDALAGWLADPVATGRGGREDLRVDPLVPTLLAPFAALSTTGELGDDEAARAETALRLQLLGVERLIAALAAARPAAADPLAVLLPLSPNHGAFGGDGIYGETKAALEVLLTRWRSEHATWGRKVALLAPRIGWVRGTGLMAANDALAARVEERLGIRTFGADEMGWLLAALATDPGLRARAEHEPLALDASGGLAALPDLRGALAPLVDELRAESVRARRRAELEAALAQRLGEGADDATVPALPRPGTDTAAAAGRELPPAPPLALDRMAVIVGTGELGCGGSGRTRFALELDGRLPAAAVAELAWLTGLARWEPERDGGAWVDAADGEAVPEERLAERYRDAVAARVGLRPLEPDAALDPAGMPVLAPLTLDRELRFTVDTEAEARAHLAADPERTRIAAHDDAWAVTLLPGARVRAPRLTPHSRRVAGQLPSGLDLTRLGVPADLVATADRMALLTLASTAEAFRDAGLAPEELLAHVHPAHVANTQGAGMGGMASLRRLLLDRLLDGERQADRLQESLGNVVAAHAVQAFVGSYGAMVHPVAACATAAVSLEEAHDKIRLGKALAVVAGGVDDLTQEGVDGFGAMGATADADELEAIGLTPAEASRANDVRRRGFVEAQGGGALLVVRGDVALALGLPVRGVLAYAASFGDGIQASIPAPGMGVLASALGGADSPLAQALRQHGLTPDDVAVVSKHDTSTELNDPNEADLHERIQQALGRTPGNPLLVVSQKTVTGHAKGGAAAWQVDGVLRTMETGLVPGNRNLECADPLLRDGAWLALGDRTLRLARDEPLRAALVTSLGFGHVSALLALAHPDVFLAAVPPRDRAAYLARAGRRRAEGVRAQLALRHGPAPELRRRDRRLSGGGDEREREAALLTDPAARLVGGAYGADAARGDG